MPEETDGADRSLCPLISVVIATHEFGAALDAAVAAVLAAPYPRRELIVVDDSWAPERQRSAWPGVKVIPNHRPRGPAGARNSGAEIAGGRILLFVDSDCEIAPDALARVASVLTAGGPDAVFGVESADMRHQNFASQYRNLWMRYALMRLPADPGHIHTSCAAIRAEMFRALSGFNEAYSILEDSDLGCRLAARGGRILRDERLAFTHHRRYDLIGLLETERIRGSAVVAWHIRKLISRDTGTRVVFTVPGSHALGLAAFGASAASIAIALGLGSGSWLTVALVAVIVSVVLRGDFLLYLKRQRGMRFFLGGVLFTIPDYIWVACGALQALMRFRRTSWISS